MHNQRKAGVVLGYANIVIKNLVNLVYTPMLLSFVGQADYGVYQTSYSFVFSLSILSFGFSEAYLRFYTQAKTDGAEVEIRRLNGMYLLLYVIICAVVFVLGLAFAANSNAVFSAGFLPEQIELARALMSVMAANIAVTLFSTVFDAYIKAHEEFCFQQSRQMLTTLATPLIAYLLLRLGMGPVGVSLAQLAVAFVLLVLSARFAIKKLGMKFDVRHPDSGLFVALASFSGWIFANQICDLTSQNVPNVLLGALTSASAVSVFAIAVSIRSVFFSLSTTMSNVFNPLINRIVVESDDNVELTKLMTKVGRYQAVLFCWVYGGFALLGRYFISVWAGEGFADAYPLVLLMTLPVAVPLCQNTGIEIQRAKDKHKPRSVAMLLAAILNIVITVFAAPFIGYWAPAIGYILSVIICNGIFMNWYYQRIIGLDMFYFWKHISPVFISGSVVTISCMAISSHFSVLGWGDFIVWGLVYSILYAAALWRFVMHDDERWSVTSRLLSPR